MISDIHRPKHMPGHTEGQTHGRRGTEDTYLCGTTTGLLRT